MHVMFAFAGDWRAGSRWRTARSAADRAQYLQLPRGRRDEDPSAPDVSLFEMNRKQHRHGDLRFVGQFARLQARRPDIPHTHGWATLVGGCGGGDGRVPITYTSTARRAEPLDSAHAVGAVDQVLSVSSVLMRRCPP
jgi:hypothetical protein